MAQVRWYLNNSLLDGWQLVDQTAAAAATCNCGWVVGTGLTNSSELQANTERASTTFVGNTVPDGTLDTTLKDAFRSQFPQTGSFAAGNWTFQFAVVSTVQAGAADGQIVFRVLKANADGSSATEITTGQQATTIATNVGATDVNITATWAAPAWTITNQYLFVQVAWKRTGAGGMTTTNIRLRTGSSTTVGTTGLTADFTPSVTTAFMASTLVMNSVSVGNTQLVTTQPIASTVAMYSVTVANTQLVTTQPIASGSSVSVPTVSEGGVAPWSAPLVSHSERVFAVPPTFTTARDLTGVNTLVLAFFSNADLVSDVTLTDSLGTAFGAPDVVQGNYFNENLMMVWVRPLIGAGPGYQIFINAGPTHYPFFVGYYGFSILGVPSLEDYAGIGVVGGGTFQGGEVTPSGLDRLGCAFVHATGPLTIGSGYTISPAWVYETLTCAYHTNIDAATNPLWTTGGGGEFHTGVNLVVGTVVIEPGAPQAVTTPLIASTGILRPPKVAHPAVGGGLVTKDVGFPVTARDPAEGVFPTQTWPAFTTPGPDRLVVAIFAGIGGGPIALATMTSPNLVWERRVEVVSGGYRVEIWTAWAESPVTGEVITSTHVAGTAYYHYRSTLIWSLEGSSADGVGNVNEAVFTGDPSISLDMLEGSFSLAAFAYRSSGSDTAPDANTTHEYSGGGGGGYGFNERAGSRTATTDGPHTLGWVGDDVNETSVIGGIEIVAAAAPGGGDQTIGGATIEGAAALVLLEDGFDVLLEDGFNLLLDARSGVSQAFAPSVTTAGLTQAVTSGTIAATSLARIPTVVPGPVTLGLPTRASTAQAFAPTIAAGAVTLTGATRASTIGVFAPVLTALLTGATIVSGSGAFPPAVAQTVLAATRPATSVVFVPAVGSFTAVGTVPVPATSQGFAPSVAVGPATLTGAFRATTILLYAPSLTALTTGATIVSGSAVFAPSVALSVTTATRGTTAQVFAPAVGLTVTGAHKASIAQCFTPTVAAGAVSVTTGTRPTTVALFAPSLAPGAVAITGATRPTTIQMFAPSVSPGPVTVLAPTIAATVVLYPPVLTSLALGSISTGHVASTSVVRAPSLTGGLVTILPPRIAATSVVSSPSVAVGPVTILAMSRLSTAQMFTPSLGSGVVTVTTGALLSAVQLSAPTVQPGVVTILGATKASTAQVFTPSVSGLAAPPQALGGSTISGPSYAYAPLVGIPSLTGGTIGQTAQAFGPTVLLDRLEIDVPLIAPTTEVYPPARVYDPNAVPPTGAISDGVTVQYLATVSDVTCAPTPSVGIHGVTVQYLVTASDVSCIVRVQTTRITVEVQQEAEIV